MELNKENKLKKTTSKEALTEEELFFIETHEKTAIFRDAPSAIPVPPIFKKYDTKKIPLERNFTHSKVSLEDAIEHRTSRRNFSGSMQLNDVAKILYYSVGFRKLVDIGSYGILYASNCPSAGSRHPIEIYVILKKVEGINDGIYHYDIQNHQLEILQEEGISAEKVSRLLNNQPSLSQANMTIFLTAIHRRTSWKYGHRSYRLVHLDAGHIGQNIYLLGEAMQLGVCGIGGWNDLAVRELLKIDGEREVVVYALVVGKEK